MNIFEQQVRDDPKLPGDSGEIHVSEWSIVGGLIPIVKSSLYLSEQKKKNKKN